MTRTFVDAGVLIAAATGRQPQVQPLAIAVLDDGDRHFLSSAFVRLEVLPKAIHGRRTAEEAFYRTFFAAVVEWADAAAIIESAFDFAGRYGLNGLDALPVAAAQATHADELVTTERPGSPLGRVREIRVVSIRPVSAVEPISIS